MDFKNYEWHPMAEQPDFGRGGDKMHNLLLRNDKGWRVQNEKGCFTTCFDTQNGFWNNAIFAPDNAILHAEFRVF